MAGVDNSRRREIRSMKLIHRLALYLGYGEQLSRPDYGALGLYGVLAVSVLCLRGDEPEFIWLLPMITQVFILSSVFASASGYFFGPFRSGK